MDVAAIAHAVTAALLPFLPYLRRLGEKAAEEGAKSIGAEAWEFAKTLWAKVSPSVEKKPAVAEAISDLAAAPQDQDAQAALRMQLRKLLESEPTLVRELQQLLAERPRAAVIVSGDRAGIFPRFC